MPRGRPRLTYETVEFRAMIPASLAAEVNLVLLNQGTGKIDKGVLGRLTTSLLREWLAKQQALVQTTGAGVNPAEKTS